MRRLSLRGSCALGLLAVSTALACASRGPLCATPSPSAPARSVAVSASSASSSAGAAPSIGVPAYPTLADAGAARCKLGVATRLGAERGGAPKLRFGARSGVAAWKSADDAVSVAPLRDDGAIAGASHTLAVAPDLRVESVRALGAGFLLLLLRWDLAKHDVRWFGVALSADGVARSSAVDLGMADMSIAAAQEADARRVVLLLRPAAIARATGLRGRWQTITIGDDGALASTPIAADVDDLLTTVPGEELEPARLDGAIGWIVSHAGGRRVDGVFDGVRRPAKDARPLRPDDAIEVEVRNGATPPPPGPGGRIYEPAAEPVLRRSHAGAPLGEALQLEVEGFPASRGGLYVEDEIAWSGSRFVYAYDRDGAARLLAIDCRP